MAKIETLSLEVDGILPDTRVFRERCFLLDGAALWPDQQGARRVESAEAAREGLEVAPMAVEPLPEGE